MIYNNTSDTYDNACKEPVMIYNNTSDTSFCGGSNLWSDAVLTQEAPAFTPCFQDTVLVYIPFGWLAVCLPFYLRYLLQKPPGFSLPLTAFSAAKSILCVVLAILVLMEVLANDANGFLCNTADIVPPSFYLGSSIRLMFHVMVAMVIQVVRRRRVYSSGILYTFWILLLLCSIIPLQSKISYQPSCPSSIIYYVYFTGVFIQCVLHSFSDRDTRLGYQYIDQNKVCPERVSSVLNKLTFWWMNSLVLRAYKGTIGMADLWEQTPELKSDICVSILKEQWQREEETCKRNNEKQHTVIYQRNGMSNGHDDIVNEKTPLMCTDVTNISKSTIPQKRKMPSLYKVLLRTYWKQWMFAACLKTIDDVCAVGQPLILRYIIQFIEHKKPSDSPDWRGYALAVTFCLAGVGQTFFLSQAVFQMMRLGLQIKTAVIGLIYQKALTKSNASKKDYSVGDIVNLISVDCQRIQDSFQFQFNVMSFFTVMTLGLVLVWYEMGVATVGSVVVIIVISALNIWFGKLQQIYQIVILSLKSSRLRLLKEVLSGIKVLKMYTWEPEFTKKILNIREDEMKYLRKVATVCAFAFVFSLHSPFFMNYTILFLYVLASSSSFLSAQKVFVALSTINVLRYPLTFTPYVISGLTQLYVSVGRIQTFLWQDDLEFDSVSNSINSAFAVSIEDGTFTWDKEDVNITLKDIELKVPEGKLIAIVGQVGSGKSSLVAALLGELVKIKGKVNVKGSVAYVPQEAWIQNINVKENILFGNTYHEKKYRKVIEACALLPDLAFLPAGDQTEIGEKGINVSGGQKQRISLARAVYKNSDIYILDDPLSAVDSHVGKQLFNQVIGQQGLLRNKTRILVTHGMHWLPMVDAIVVMDDGRIREMGSYEELLQYKGMFAELLQIYLIQVSNKDSEEEEDLDVSKIKNRVLDNVENGISDYGGGSPEESISPQNSIRHVHPHHWGATITSSVTEQSQDSRVCGMRSPDPMASSTSRRGSSQCQDNTEAISNYMSKGSIPKMHVPLSNERVLSFNKKDVSNEVAALTQKETTVEGAVRLTVFLSYLRAMGMFGAILPVVFMTIFQGLNIYGNFILTLWTEDDLVRNTTLSDTEEYRNRNLYYLGIYTLLGILQTLILIVLSILGLHRIVRASGVLHSTMLLSVMKLPMSFFDTTPIGRIMNRFSSDIDILDNRLPRTYRILFSMFFSLLGILAVISIYTPAFLVAIFPVGVLYVIALKLYLPTARQLKRIESITRSPIYNHYSESISGASSIRAYGATGRFIKESQRRVDQNSAFYFAAISGLWWIGVRLQFLGNILILVAALFSIIQTGINGADIGLSLTYSMQIIIALNSVVQSISELEMNVVSVERIEEYTKIQQEAEWIIEDKRPTLLWPESGTVRFENYAMRYRPGLDLVLKDINCNIKDGEKVGIVGRTGAGKSSLTMSVFRLIESASGCIVIDGVRVSDIGLHDLRSKITILPQEPVLFSGTLKMNLDPLCLYPDSDIWEAIERAHLKSFIRKQPEQLQMDCGEGGSNLSIGQRQLVCLARALLRKTRILILDEATSAVDIETDELIQETIRTEFPDCTVLTIAHRLNTVMDYDRIMVLDNGFIAEFDPPKCLLENKNGIFYKMAKDANLVDKHFYEKRTNQTVSDSQHET